MNEPIQFYGHFDRVTREVDTRHYLNQVAHHAAFWSNLRTVYTLTW